MEAKEVLRKIEEKGFEAYIVGGYVRDKLMGIETSDIDICTNATPRQVQEIFKGAKLPFEGYGSVHLSYKNINFEITTYRMDLEYKDKRKPQRKQKDSQLAMNHWRCMIFYSIFIQQYFCMPSIFTRYYIN